MLLNASTLFTDLAAFINRRISQPIGAPEKVYRVVTLGTQNVKRMYNKNRYVDYVQDHVAPIL